MTRSAFKEVSSHSTKANSQEIKKAMPFLFLAAMMFFPLDIDQKAMLNYFFSAG
jgi:hypothetical protein